MDDGLSQNTINYIYQDKNGFMWFATQDGLNRYDGYNFRIFKNEPGNENSLSNNYVWFIYEDVQGIFWLGSFGGGLTRFDPTTENFKNYRKNPQNPSGISDNVVASILEFPKGILWLGTNEGLNRFDMNTEKFKTYLNHDNTPEGFGDEFVTFITPQDKDIIWFIYKGILTRMNTSTEKFSYFEQDPFNSKITFGAIYYMINDENGIVILCSAGIVHLDFHNQEAKTLISSKLINKQNNKYIFQRILNDNRGYYWIATDNGLLQYEKNTQQIYNYTYNPENKNGLIHNNIVSLYKSNDGVIWIGTRVGLSKIENVRSNFKLVKEKLNTNNTLSYKSVGPILKDSRGILWIGTPGGLNAYEKKIDKFSHFKYDPQNKNSLASGYILSLLEDSKKNIWVGTRNGGLNNISFNKGNDLNNVNIERFTTKRTGGKTINTVQFIYEDNENLIWIGTGGHGLIKFDPVKNEFTQYNSATDGAGPSHPFIYSIFEDNYGNFWVGTVGGLNLFDKKTEKFIYFNNEEQNLNSLSNNIILCIYNTNSVPGKNSLWAGTSNGLNKLAITLRENLFEYFRDSADVKNDSLFVRFGTKNGLPNEVIYGILEDSNGCLWISTNKGLAKFNPAKNSTETVFDVFDGLQNNEFNQNAFFKDKNGNMYFGGVDGLNIFHPDSIKLNEFIPPVYFTDFKLFNEPVPLSNSSNDNEFSLKKNITYLNELDLNYNHDVISFDFSALNFITPEKNEYAYFMEGFDREWTYCGNKRSVTYTNLDPGEYIFKVKACNNDGTWNENAASLKIYIPPPPWLSWYAYLFYIMIFTGAVFLFIRNRINVAKRELETQAKIERAKSEEREEVRKKSSADFHDEAGNKLTKITLFTELAKNISGDNPSVIEYLEKIEENTKEISSGMRDFIWVLDPAKDTLHDTISRLKDFGYSMFGFTDIKFNVTGLTNEMSRVSLSMERRRAIMLIFKEAMNNCMKYSEAKHIALNVSLDEKKLTLTLSDDGAGFDVKEESEGYGLRNMRYRASKADSEISIESEPGKGTKIIFKANIVQMGY